MAEYAQLLITNTSGETKTFSWIPPQGRELEDGQTVSIPYYQLNAKSDLRSLNRALENGIVRAQRVPEVDASEVAYEPMYYQVAITDESETLFDSDNPVPRNLRLIGAEFHCTRGVSDGWTGDLTIEVDDTEVTDAEALDSASEGDLIDISNIDAYADVVSGQQLDVVITDDSSATGRPEGHVRLKFMPVVNVEPTPTSTPTPTPTPTPTA